ncbi:MAG: HU family DNA-binding protein [Thermoanaerobaculia bacterium]|mgnify:CR=1 FL=1
MDPKKGLTKADLIDAVYHRHGGLTKAEASEIVEAIFATVKTTLGDGRPVRIKNFGNFEITARPTRVGVNPTNGEKILIPSHKGLSFKPARRLKSSVDARERDMPGGPGPRGRRPEKV